MVALSNLSWPTIVFIFCAQLVLSICDLMANSSNIYKGCVFPRQYEGFNLQSNYFGEDNHHMVVDCDRQMVYEKSLLPKGDVYTIKDLKSGKFYIIAPNTCMWSKLTPEMMGHECQVPEDAEFTGETVLDGRDRYSWSRLQGPFKYKLIQVVTRVTIDQDGFPGCLPFLFRLTHGESVISGTFFYELRRGISDPSVFTFDSSGCIEVTGP